MNRIDPIPKKKEGISRPQLMRSLAGMAGTAGLFFAFVLCGGWVAGKSFEMSSFQGSLVLVGALLIMVMVWAVRSLAGVAIGLSHEIKAALDGLETMWADSDEDVPEEWQDWCATDMDRRFYSRDRVGEPLCPCGSGKPYSLCCGKKN